VFWKINLILDELSKVNWNPAMAKIISRENIIDVLRRYKLEHQKEYGIEMLGIFGSIARGQATETSDVDVVIRTKTPNLFLLSRIRQELEEECHLHVDIISYREKMNRFLKKRIDSEAHYV